MSWSGVTGVTIRPFVMLCSTRPWIVGYVLVGTDRTVGRHPGPQKSPPGPRPVADRHCLRGILYVLYNDLAWQLLPLELGFGSGQTCWRRLERWQQERSSTSYTGSCWPN